MLYLICFLIFLGCHILREIMLYTFGIAPSAILVTFGAFALCGAYAKYYHLNKPEKKIIKNTKDFYDNYRIAGVSHEQFAILVKQYSEVLSIKNDDILNNDNLIDFEDIIQIIMQYNLTNELFEKLKENHQNYCSDGDRVIKLVTVTRKVLQLPDTPKGEANSTASQSFTEAMHNEQTVSDIIHNKEAAPVKGEMLKENNEEKLFCRKCGAKLRFDSVFCDKCGTKVINLN
ncbi:MAG: zinc ribbon domain-containing protein [Pseudobutyrivibrio ruminis]|uniref:Zinc ribbon domain-containing protein n=1 Tax=Pseudobutyrivibrio ruminis TaxID=46206 RepID=A0A927YRX6_9FIRM|nr:zinc ribbon domain-containing protein [Pseudobutyrivibrio ruminis]MBE5920973.1 zinc ribbon domain-containing protein [Pseudobutyrivibrio ruminis]